MTQPTALKPLFDALAGYPDWLVVAVLTVLAVGLIWLLAKVLKWGLYILMALLLVAGVIATLWLLLDIPLPPTV